MHLKAILGAFLAANAVLGISLESIPQRPNLSQHPKQLGHGKGWHNSPSRNPFKLCIVPFGKADDSPAILQSFKKCNNGGTVVFLPYVTYTVASPLDLTFLKHVDVAILGKIQIKDDVAYWQSHFFNFAFQATSTVWKWGGEDVNIFGLGLGEIDGLGNTWWKAAVLDKTVVRPILFTTDGLKGGSISGLKMTNSPNWFNLISNSSDILITDMHLNVKTENTTYPAKNTDGWDTFRSSNIVIQNSVITNTDDCVSFKPNSTNILVQNLKCTGSHGISVGSLGQYRNEIDIVENLYIYNISMTNATDAARIKVWPGQPADSGIDNAGGGAGYVKNVTYEVMGISNVDNALSLIQCYGSPSQAFCDANPASLIIEDVLFKDFTGVVSKKFDPQAGSLVCSSNTVCKNIRAQDIDVKVPSGKVPNYKCVNIDKSLLAINCL